MTDMANTIHLARNDHELVQIVLNYLIDSSMPFAILKEGYEGRTLRIEVGVKIDPNQILRITERLLGRDPDIDISLGMVQMLGDKPIVMIAGAVDEAPPIPEALHRAQAADQEGASMISRGIIGRALKPEPETWHRAQQELDDHETLVYHVICPAHHTQVMLRLRDSTEYLGLMTMLSEKHYQSVGTYAVPVDSVEWLSAAEVIKVEGLDPDRVVDPDRPEEEG